MSNVQGVGTVTQAPSAPDDPSEDDDTDLQNALTQGVLEFALMILQNSINDVSSAITDGDD